MSLIADVTLSGDVILFEDALDATPAATYTFENVYCDLDAADRGHRYAFFWWTTGCSVAEAEAALDADPTVEAVRTVCDVEDATLHRVDTVAFPADQPLVFPTLRRHDATWVAARRDADGFHVRARFPDRDALDAFVDAANEVAATVDVRRLREADGRTAADYALTDRQREALETAHERGYFATPTEVSLDTLAEEFDVTPQTLSRHLRVAVEKVVGDAVGHASVPLQDPSQ